MAEAARLGRRLLAHRGFLIGAAVFALVVAGAVLAPLLSPYAPDRMIPRSRFLPPGERFLFGTDNFGRDLLSRVLWGSRISLTVGVAVVVITGLLGVAIGAVAGYVRALENPLMRVMDALMAFPAVLLAIAITAALGPSVLNVVIALAVTYTPRTARIVRASVTVVKRMEFVEAARAAGAGHLRILATHILPNSLGPLIVQLTFVFAYAILAESVLSFIGLGPPPPTATWGNIIADGRNYIREATWITLFPGLFISLTVLSLNLVGDGLRDVLDPRMRIET
jgi:peptide/nickel transport system permease protein